MQTIETITAYIRDNINILSSNILYLNEGGLKRLSYLYTIYSDTVAAESPESIVEFMFHSSNRDDYLRYCSDIIAMVKL